VVFTLLYAGLAAVAGWLMIRQIRSGPPPAQSQAPGEAEPEPVFSY
jgi:cytochrome d ubiquinol oxidase subunit I